MGNKYAISNKEGFYFITFATVEWVDVFTRKDYAEIFINNLNYCIKNKGLVVYCWCLMSNHFHMIAEAADNNLSDILRDFKSYTSKKIIEGITTLPESRREWMLNIFKQAGKANSNNLHYQFWQQDNHYVEIFNRNFWNQKMEYIHNNPVTAGIVENAQDYRYSSAKDHYSGRHLGLVQVTFFDENCLSEDA